ncbi:Paired amphipathic helix protein Sin3-like 4 [Cardamine amara subsp. amara]|uniref:Paired amphipathic helix protein Sin3-like 4 n=1 Tax=Cardamine amara subsp. amara TaxID=228776 RepID=A0ABD1BI31_CARAN
MVDKKKLTTDDAFAFLMLVKVKYQDKREIYDRFLEILKDFKAQRANTCDVISKVKELFKGQQELLLGFNTFLPEDSHIHPEEDDQTPPKMSMHFDDAINFVKKVKTKLQNDHAYKSFLDVLKSHRKEYKSVAELYQEVSIIFQDHPDLLVDFHDFLPR